MKSRFDFQNVHRATGALVLVTATVLLLALLAAARVQRWFEPVYRLEVELPKSGARGLEVGADVEMLGTPIGRVDAITLDEDESRELVARARLVLRGEMVRFVREDSEVILKSGGLALGEPYLEITRGVEHELFAEGERETQRLLPVVPEMGALEQAQEVALELQGRLDLTLGKVDALLDATTTTVNLVNDPDAEVRTLLRGVDTLVAQLEREGLVGYALRDPQWGERIGATIDAVVQSLGAIGGAADELAHLLHTVEPLATPVGEALAQAPRMTADTQVILDHVRAILDRVREASSSLPAIAQSLEGEASSLPGMLAESQETLRQIEILVRAIQQHWLIRSYVEPRPGEGRIPLDEVGGPEGVE